MSLQGIFPKGQARRSEEKNKQARMIEVTAFLKKTQVAVQNLFSKRHSPAGYPNGIVYTSILVTHLLALSPGIHRDDIYLTDGRVYFMLDPSLSDYRISIIGPENYSQRDETNTYQFSEKELPASYSRRRLSKSE